MRQYIILAILCFLLPLGLLAQEEGKNMIRVKKLSDEVNDPENDDLAPTISGDGKVMYFVRFSPNTLQDVYVSRRADINSEWGKAEALPSPINNDENNVVCGTNYDGTLIFLSNSYDGQGKKFENMKPGISISFKDGESWVNPITIDLEGLSAQKLSKSSNFYYHVYDNGFHLLISFLDSSRKKPSEGEEDIYYCALKGAEGATDLPKEYIDLLNEGKSSASDLEFKELVTKYAKSLNYKVIQHIGTSGNINTKGFETAPLLSYDSKTLYFTRQKGNADKSEILAVSRTDLNDWDSWGKSFEPYKEFTETKGSEGNIGSDKFDAYFIFEKEIGEGNYTEERREKESEILLEKGYFSSSRSSKNGTADLYMFEIIRPIPFNAELIVNVVDCELNSLNLLEIDSLAVTVKVLDPDGKPADFKKADGKISIKINKIGEYSILAQTGNRYYTSDDRASKKVKFVKEEDGKVKTETLCLINKGIAAPKGIFYFAFDRYKEFFINPIPASEEDSTRLVQDFKLDLRTNKFNAGTANITNYEEKQGNFFTNGAATETIFAQNYAKFFRLVSDLEASKSKYKYIFISGFADIIGSDKSNLVLSENRALTLAKEIYNRLAKDKTNEEKKQLKQSIIIDSQGSANHLTSGTDNITWEDRAKSRRVTILTLDNESVQTTDGSTIKVNDKTKFKSLGDYTGLRLQ